VSLKNIKKWALDRGFEKQQSDRNGYTANIVEELGEWQAAWDNNNEHEKVDALNDIIVFSITELLKMGYDVEKTLNETYKEIDSRTGEWDPGIQKWVKYKTPEAKEKWVSADYSDSRL
jgi:hypothetical protein